MSKPLRIALVGEGPTERLVIEAILSNILSNQGFILRQLQPEESLPFGEIGTGWVGVYRWCRQAVDRANGALRNDILFQSYDVLILQLDADVADESYANGQIIETAEDLPCSQDCPPSSASTNPLRAVLLRWCGEVQTPAKTVLCTPSKSTDAWVVAALYPNDIAVRRGVECWPNPESRLGQQPLHSRIKKSVEDYQDRLGDLEAAWPNLVRTLEEARRFDAEFRALLS